MSPRARGEGKSPIRSFRVDNDIWDPFVEAVDRSGKDRTAVLREFMAWYARQAGAKMPRRPDPSEPA